jgi:hypothetical protein
MKPFLLFAFAKYHPAGGSGDFRSAHATLAEARAAAEELIDGSRDLEHADGEHFDWLSIDELRGGDLVTRLTWGRAGAYGEPLLAEDRGEGWWEVSGAA